MKKAFSFLAALLFAVFFFIPQAAASDTDAVSMPHPDMGSVCADCHTDEELAGVDAVTPAVTVSAADTDASGSTGAPADATSSDADLLEDGKEVVSLFRSQEWALGASALIMLLLALLRRFHVLDRLPSKYVPWAAATFGVLASLADALSTGGAVTVHRVVMGLAAGMAASGMWGLVGKHIPFLAPPAKS